MSEKLRELLATGMSCGRIAKELSSWLGQAISRNAIIGRKTRMGLTTHKRIDTATKRAPRVRPKKRLFISKRSNSVPGFYEEKYVDNGPTTNDQEIPLAQRKTLLQLTSKTCRWPVGSPEEIDFFFCGAESAEGRPYCLSHCRVAFYLPRPRGESRPFFQRLPRTR